MRRNFPAWLAQAHPPEKMLFLAGPRQVGKTTLAREALAAHADGGDYLSWDIAAHRRRILGNADLLSELRHPNRRPLLVLDEVHKLRRFKAWLKGLYDAHRDEAAFWITGSARLDLHQRGADSLVGRYFLYRLHPLSVGEVLHPDRPLPDPDRAWTEFEGGDADREDVGALMRFGGFPEPFARHADAFHRRWLRLRREQLTHQDLRDLTRIADLDRVEYLVELLNPRIGAPLSLNSMREDLGVAFETVRNWVGALDRVYYVFGVRPYDRRVARGLRRERKLYYWDWSEARDEAARFENFVMAHLRKACHAWTDFGVGDFSLWYVRDKEKREVDALVTRDGRPWLMVEVKQGDQEVAGGLLRFSEALACPRAVQVVATPGVRRRVKVDGRTLHVTCAAGLLRFLP